METGKASCRVGVGWGRGQDGTMLSGLVGAKALLIPRYLWSVAICNNERLQLLQIHGHHINCSYRIDLSPWRFLDELSTCCSCSADGQVSRRRMFLNQGMSEEDSWTKTSVEGWSWVMRIRVNWIWPDPSPTDPIHLRKGTWHTVA